MELYKTFYSISKLHILEYIRPESVEMPENSTLDLYIQIGVKQEDGKGYQNLLGTFLIDKNSKEIIEIEKEKSKKKKFPFLKMAKKGL